jgi:hypothetical protein
MKDMPSEKTTTYLGAIGGKTHAVPIVRSRGNQSVNPNITNTKAERPEIQPKA